MTQGPNRELLLDQPDQYFCRILISSMMEIIWRRIPMCKKTASRNQMLMMIIMIMKMMMKNKVPEKQRKGGRETDGDYYKEMKR